MRNSNPDDRPHPSGGSTPTPSPSYALSAALLLVLLVLSRWLSHADHLLNADAAQYARALFVFDLAARTPHAPGYVIFIYAARLVHLLIQDPNGAYLIVNLCAQAGLILLTLHLLRRFIDPLTALLLSGTLLFNPLYWFYGSIAAIYTTDALMFLLVVWGIDHDARARSRNSAVWLGLVWGLVGGVRQFTAVLTVPVLLWHVVRQHRWRDIGWMILSATMGVALWLIPLLILAGGWAEYHRISSDVFHYYLTTRSPLFARDIFGIFYNIVKWILALAQVAWPLLPVLILAWLVRKRPVRNGLVQERIRIRGLILILVVPALAFFLLVHMGQAGYMLFFLAPLLLFVAVTIAPHMESPGVRRHVRRGILVTIVLSVGWFSLAFPPNRETVSTLEPGAFVKPSNWPLILKKVYKYQADFTGPGIGKWDRVIGGYLEALRMCPPDSTVALYVDERELPVSLLHYYVGSLPIVEKDRVADIWQEHLAGSRDVHIVRTDALTRLRLGPAYSAVLVIDANAGPNAWGEPLHVPALDEFGKVPRLLRRPTAATIEGLEIVWAESP